MDGTLSATAATELRRRGWEAACMLLQDYRDRLNPDEYRRALDASRTDPDTLHHARAAAMLRLWARKVEARR